MLSSEFNCRNHSSKLSFELVHAVNCHKIIDIIVNIKKNDISIMELELEESRNTLLAAHSKRTVCNHFISQMMTEQQPSAQHAFITSQLMLLCPSHPTVFCVCLCLLAQHKNVCCVCTNDFHANLSTFKMLPMHGIQFLPFFCLSLSL